MLNDTFCGKRNECTVSRNVPNDYIVHITIFVGESQGKFLS